MFPYIYIYVTYVLYNMHIKVYYKIMFREYAHK